MGTESQIREHYGNNTLFHGRFQSLWRTRALKIQWLAKAVDYGMEEVFGSTPNLIIPAQNHRHNGGYLGRYLENQPADRDVERCARVVVARDGFGQCCTPPSGSRQPGSC
jgi:hypothetical protein